MNFPQKHFFKAIFIAYQVNRRHAFLKWLITVKDEEVTSFQNINTCLETVTTCLCVFSVMEVAAYFIYVNWVSDDTIIQLTLFL